MERLFAQAGLPRRFLERGFGVNQIAQGRERLGGFAFRKHFDRTGIERPRKLAVAFDPRPEGPFLVSHPCHLCHDF